MFVSTQTAKIQSCSFESGSLSQKDQGQIKNLVTLNYVVTVHIYTTKHIKVSDQPYLCRHRRRKNYFLC